LRLDRKISFIGMLCGMCFSAYGETLPLVEQIEITRSMCSGISNSMSELKTMAGINTAVTAVGTVAGGVALGTGIAKAVVDKEAEKLDSAVDETAKKLEEAGYIKIETKEQFALIFADMLEQTDTPEGRDMAHHLRYAYNGLNQKSKLLGNIRTGTLAAAAVTGTAGAVIASLNRVKGGLKQRVNNCIKSVDALSLSYTQARLDGTDTRVLTKAEKILHECGAWKNVSLSKINDRATGAAISSGIGAAMAVTGTATSAVANTDKIRNDNTAAGKKKEDDLNIVSNVMAGGTMVAQGVATVFNATQIVAIKDAVKVADKCEEAFND